MLKRALAGLSGSKSSKDLAKIEDMLVSLLDDVERLKQEGGPASGLPEQQRGQNKRVTGKEAATVKGR